MQDVVTLPFPLTWLWRSGEASENVNVAGNHVNKFRGVKRKADGDATTIPASNGVETLPRTDEANNDMNTTTPADQSIVPATEQATPAPSSTNASTPAPGTPKPKKVLTGTNKSSPTPFSLRKKPNLNDIEFKDGTAPIPAEINNLSLRIHACDHHSNHMPVKQQLKNKLKEHFYMSSAHLKPISPLYKWFGDTRLFSKEEWVYLMGVKGEEGSEGNPVVV